MEKSDDPSKSKRKKETKLSEICGYEDIKINGMDGIYFGSDYSSDDMSDADSNFEPFL